MIAASNYYGVVFLVRELVTSRHDTDRRISAKTGKMGLDNYKVTCNDLI